MKQDTKKIVKKGKSSKDGEDTPGKIQHRQRIIEHVADPDNDLPTKKGLAKLCGFKTVQCFYNLFPPVEYHEIMKEALALRRERYAAQLACIDQALIVTALTGNVPAIKLAYQRFEGWAETSKNELTGKDGAGPMEWLVEVVHRDKQQREQEHDE